MSTIIGSSPVGTNFGRPPGATSVTVIGAAGDTTTTVADLSVADDASVISVASVDTIAEYTAGAGVTIDGLLVKDGVVQGLRNVAAAAADAAISVDGKSRTVFITKGTAAALTLANPTTTTHDGMELVFVATTAAAHTVSNAAGSGFFSSGGGTKDVATFGGAIGDGFACVAYQGKWYVDPRGVTNVTLG